MQCIVTGAAGFLGSHLCEELLRQGHKVTGLDAFLPHYPEVIKHRNLLDLLRHPNLRFYRVDLCTDPIEELLGGAEVVFHLAAMPELHSGWTDLEASWRCNVLATQKLLEAIQRCGIALERFVFASSSSVYGGMASGDETLPTRPLSAHGLSKLAAEYVCGAYAEVHPVPVVTLRYFSVYGPRQRPDMDYHRVIEAILHNKSVSVYGEGQQMSGPIYVADCVQATIAAMQAPAGEVYNVGGGPTASIWDILNKLETLAGHKVKVKQKPTSSSDPLPPCPDIRKARRQLGWTPQTSLEEGLARQWEWQSKQHASTFLSSNNSPLPTHNR